MRFQAPPSPGYDNVPCVLHRMGCGFCAFLVCGSTDGAWRGGGMERMGQKGVEQSPQSGALDEQRNQAPGRVQLEEH